MVDGTWYPGSKCPKCSGWGYLKPLLSSEPYKGTFWVCRDCSFEWLTKWVTTVRKTKE